MRSPNVGRYEVAEIERRTDRAAMTFVEGLPMDEFGGHCRSFERLRRSSWMPVGIPFPTRSG